MSAPKSPESLLIIFAVASLGVPLLMAVGGTNALIIGVVALLLIDIVLTVRMRR